MVHSISVIIFTHNSQYDIEECISSARLLSDTIHVIDMESTDKTQEIAQAHDAHVFSFPYQTFVEPSRTFGIHTAKTDWVFILDADERITKELADECLIKIQNTSFAFFKVPRKNIFGKTQWLRHGGWWPDYQTRIIRTSAFVAWPKRIHAVPTIKGSGATLVQPILHYFHGDIEQMVNKTIVFESIESNLLCAANRNANTRIFFRKYFGELWRRLFKNQGFRDGIFGIIESVYQAYSKTITYLFLYEKKISRSV